MNKFEHYNVTLFYAITSQKNPTYENFWLLNQSEIRSTILLDY